MSNLRSVAAEEGQQLPRRKPRDLRTASWNSGARTAAAPVTHVSSNSIWPPANQALTVRWTVPSRATQAEVETRDFGPQALPDTGAYMIAGANNPARPDQRIRVFRFNEVNIAGGLLGSRMRVQVRNTVEPVTIQ